MENNKEIGTFFKQKLEGIDKLPSDAVWTKIDNDLNKNKRKRFVFWFFPVASILVLSFVGYYWNNSNNSEKTNQNKLKNAIVISKKNENLTKKNQILIDKNENSLVQNDSLKTMNEPYIVNEIIYDTVKKSKNYISKNSFQSNKKLIKSTKDYDVYEVTKKYRYIVRRSKNNSKNIASTISNKQKSNSRIAKTNTKTNNSKEPKGSNITNIEKGPEKDLKIVTSKNAEIISENKEPKTVNKDSILTAISKEKTAKIQNKIQKIKKPTDSTKTYQKPEEESFNLYLSPFIAANYYGVFGKSNPLSSIYDNNSKSGNITFGYGLYARTMVNDKFGFRAGYSYTKLEYNIIINKTSSAILDYNNIIYNQETTDSKLKAIFVNDNTLTLTQSTDYIELPVEMYYKVNDDKFGIATIFGGSLLIIKNNYINLKSDNVSQFQVSNEKSTKSIVLFTGNLGVNFWCKYNDRLNFDLSPILKYQFSGIEKPNGIKPIIFSLQAGISYKLF